MRSQRRKNQKGQSLIELLLTIFAFMTILFMSVQVSFSFGVANYVQYATYMASRALLSGYATTQEQIDAAKRVLVRMLKKGDQDRFPGIMKAAQEGDPQGAINVGATQRARVSIGTSAARDLAWEQGVSFKFRARLYMMVMTKGPRSTFVDLESQSWLGREPSDEECLRYINSKQGTVDNGC
ncbi:MAG: TadE/TadG family type IV pilus assembly protein [Bacteriovoracia bacterium]